MADDLPPMVLVLTGPTASGKSDWAMELAQELPVEIVSVDSALVYRELDVGTAKPSPEERQRVPHHLIDIRDPAETYSAGQFVEDAVSTIADIRARGRIPLLVGGTMLYLRALFGGMAELPRASAELRQQIDDRAAREGWSALHDELSRLDPVAAARIHPNDPQRIQRALEVCYATGRPISELQRSTESSRVAFQRRCWALVPGDRAVLHTRIERRFHEMMRRGLLDEVVGLHGRGDLTVHHPAIRAVGYRQLWAHLEGECGLDEAVQRAIAATRQLAKRQLTWIRSDKEIKWIDPEADGARERWHREVRAGLAELGR